MQDHTRMTNKFKKNMVSGVQGKVKLPHSLTMYNTAESRCDERTFFLTCVTPAQRSTKPNPSTNNGKHRAQLYIHKHSPVALPCLSRPGKGHPILLSSYSRCMAHNKCTKRTLWQPGCQIKIHFYSATRLPHYFIFFPYMYDKACQINNS